MTSGSSTGDQVGGVEAAIEDSGDARADAVRNCPNGDEGR